MYLSYNTNGFAHHDVFEAIEVLADLGYQGVALTLDHGVLNPFDPRLSEQVLRMRELLERRGLRSVVETGARFLLNSREKHEPTLLSATAVERHRRVGFLCRAIDVACQLGSDCVSLWSGVLREPMDRTAAYARLAEGLARVLEYAEVRGMPLGFEPEPGMLVATMADYGQLLTYLDGPLLKLTLDIGHLHCQGECPIADVVRAWRDRLVNVHIEDMAYGVHEHRMFGEGEIDFEPILASLEAIGYRGGLHVELSRHSHQAPVAARKAFDFLVQNIPHPRKTDDR